MWSGGRNRREEGEIAEITTILTLSLNHCTLHILPLSSQVPFISSHSMSTTSIHYPFHIELHPRYLTLVACLICPIFAAIPVRKI